MVIHLSIDIKKKKKKMRVWIRVGGEYTQTHAQFHKLGYQLVIEHKPKKERGKSVK